MTPNPRTPIIPVGPMPDVDVSATAEDLATFQAAAGSATPPKRPLGAHLDAASLAAAARIGRDLRSRPVPKIMDVIRDEVRRAQPPRAPATPAAASPIVIVRPREGRRTRRARAPTSSDDPDPPPSPGTAPPICAWCHAPILLPDQAVTWNGQTFHDADARVGLVRLFGCIRAAQADALVPDRV